MESDFQVCVVSGESSAACVAVFAGPAGRRLQPWALSRMGKGRGESQARRTVLRAPGGASLALIRRRCFVASDSDSSSDGDQRVHRAVSTSARSAILDLVAR